MKALQIIIFGLCLLACIVSTAMASEDDVPTQLMEIAGNNTFINLSVTDMATDGLMNVTWAATDNSTANKTSYKAVCVARNQIALDNLKAAKKDFQSRSREYQSQHPLEKVKTTEGSTMVGKFSVKWLIKSFRGEVTGEMLTMSFAEKGLRDEFKKESRATHVTFNLV